MGGPGEKNAVRMPLVQAWEAALGAQGRAKCPWVLIFLPGARKCSEPVQAGAGNRSMEEAGLGGSLLLGQGQDQRKVLQEKRTRKMST